MNTSDDESKFGALQPVNSRRVEIIVGILAAFFAILMCLVSLIFWPELWHQLTQAGPLPEKSRSTWLAGPIISFIGLFLGFYSWKLLWGKTSANGVTRMPTWFIQLCGVMFMALAGISIYNGGIGPGVNCLFLGLALVLLSRRFRRNRRAVAEDAEALELSQRWPLLLREPVVKIPG